MVECHCRGVFMQLNITYRLPTIEDEDILKDYVKEHYDSGENKISASMGLATMDYREWVEKINRLTEMPEDDWGRSYLYLVCFNDHLVGLINIRWEMSEELCNIYGNIGYGVRPSSRRMGFATEMLRHGLQICKEKGLQYAITGCVKDNIASARTMLRCGGQLIRETDATEYKPGIMKQYYRFRLIEEPQIPEVWDLYDKNRNLVDIDHIRGVWPIPDDCYHLVVHVWIKNSDGKYLISQRSAKREHNPLMWECCGGAVIKGEDSLTGAIREIYEEVGINLNPTGGRIVFSRLRDVVGGKRFGDIMDVWMFNYDGEPSLLNATTDEVAQTRWATVEEIKKLYDNGEFVQTLGYFFKEVAGV